MKNTTCQNLWDAIKMLTGKLRTLNTFIKRFKVKDLSFSLKKLKKKIQAKSKVIEAKK